MIGSVSGLPLQLQAAALLGLLAPQLLFPRKPDAFRVQLLMAALFSVLFLFNLGLSQLPLAMALGAGFALAASSPAGSLSFLTALMFLRPWELLEDPALLLLPRWAALFTALSWLAHRVFAPRALETDVRGGMLSLSDPLWFWFAGIVLWFYLSALLGVDFDRSHQFYLDGFLRSAVLFVLLASIPEDSEQLALLKRALLLGSLGVALIGLLQYRAGGELGEGARLGGIGILANANDSAAVMILGLPFALFQRTRAHLWATLVRGAVVAVTAYAVWCSQSRGALLALLLVLAVTASWKTMLSPRFPWRRALLALAVIGLAFAGLKSQLRRSPSDLEESSASRIEYWKAAGRMAITHPLAGVGIGNYPVQFERHASSIRYEWGERTAHSSWFLVLGETGIIGLILFVGFVGSLFRSAWRSRFEHGDLWVALLGYLLIMSFLSHSYLIYPYVLFGLIVAGARLSDRKARALGGVLTWVLAIGMTSFVSSSPAWASAGKAAGKTDGKVELLGVAGGEKPLGKKAPAVAPQWKMAGSRGEILDFQLRVRGLKGCAPLRVHAGSASVRFFEMPPLKVQERSYPRSPAPGVFYDPLLPLSGNLICKNGWLWGEIRIPADEEVGTRSVELELQGARASFELKIWKMRMPEEPSLPILIPYFSWYGVLGHVGKWDPIEGKLAQAYRDLLLEHRITPLQSWVARPRILAQPGGYAALDLRHQPDGEASFESVVLGHARPGQWIEFPMADPAWPKEERVRYWRALQETVMQSKLQGRALVYLWDEPKEKDLALLAALGREIRQHAPGLKTFATTGYRKELASVVDIFVPLLDRAPEQKEASRGWWYVSCVSHGCTGEEDPGLPDLVLDRPSSFVRVIAWMSSFWNFSGFFYYGANHGYQFYPRRDPWKSLWDFTGNGDGTLVYPGRPGERGMSRHLPLPSVRLKLLRQASYDAEYLRWIQTLPSASRPPGWDTAFRQLIQTPQHWERSYEAYERLRLKAGDFLNER